MTEKGTVQPILSLCIPTNGKAEWILPVLDSIYSQGVDEAAFEVVVTDNGTDSDLAAKMEKLLSEHRNLVYQRNDSRQFYNQLEALKLGRGTYLKFLNHRAVLEAGGLGRMIEIVRENSNRKPTLFMANGFMKKERIDCPSFDAFVRAIGIYASWTTGLGSGRKSLTGFGIIWKSTGFRHIPACCFHVGKMISTGFIMTSFPARLPTGT